MDKLHGIALIHLQLHDNQTLIRHASLIQAVTANRINLVRSVGLYFSIACLVWSIMVRSEN